MKHLLKMLDMSKDEIIDVLNLADQLKYETKHKIKHHYLAGKSPGYDIPEVFYKNKSFL